MAEEDVEINEELIRKATSAGNITFSTLDFGKGTKFDCRDEVVLANGGVHLIQTFWADNKSDETQIKGRTARHGNVGSY